MSALEDCLLEYVQRVNGGCLTEYYDLAQSDITAACRALVMRGALRVSETNPHLYSSIRPTRIERSQSQQTFEAMRDAFFRGNFACCDALPPLPFHAAGAHEKQLFSAFCELGFVTGLADGSYLWTPEGVSQIKKWR